MRKLQVYAIASIFALMSSLTGQFLDHEGGVRVKEIHEPYLKDSEDSGIDEFSRVISLGGLKALTPSSTMSEILSRGGFCAPVRFLSFLPSYYIDGEEVFFTGNGAIEITSPPIEPLNDIRIESSLYSARYGGVLLHNSVSFALPETLLQNDYTRISAHWGTSKRQRISGIFLKKIGNLGAFGASASQMKGENYQNDGDFEENDYSAIAWLRWRSFRLSAFGTRSENDSDIPAPMITGWNSSASQLKGDRMLLDTKLSYSLPKAKLTLRFNHQDEIRRYYGHNENLDYYSKNLFYLDGGSFSAIINFLKLAKIDITAGARTWTIDRHEQSREVVQRFHGAASANISLSQRLSALIAYRGESDIDWNLEHSPSVGLSAKLEDHSTIVIGGYYREGGLPMRNLLRPMESDLLLSPAGEQQDTIIFRKIGGDSAQTEKTLGAESAWIYALPTGMTLEFRAGYVNSENPAIWSFTRDSVSENLQIVEWRQTGKGDRLTMIPLSASFKYSPDDYFELFAGYQYNQIETDSTILFGIPKHRITVYAKETREYWESNGKLTLRIEGEAFLGLPKAEGGEIDPISFARVDIRFDYLSFSLFAFGEYAFSKTADGWKGSDYYIDTFPGGGCYELPKWSLRAGLEWVFLD